VQRAAQLASAPATTDAFRDAWDRNVRAVRRVARLEKQRNLALAIRLMERLERRWFTSQLRASLTDGERERAKLLRTTRAVRLLLFWARAR